MKKYIPHMVLITSVILSIGMLAAGYLLFTVEGNKLLGNQPASVSVSNNTKANSKDFTGKKPTEIITILANETLSASRGLNLTTVFAKPDFEIEFLP